MKTDVKQQEIKYLHLIFFYRGTFSKLEMQCKTGIYIRFDLGWYITSSLILPVKKIEGKTISVSDVFRG